MCISNPMLIVEDVAKLFFLQNLALHQLTRYKPADFKECVLNIHDLYLSRRGTSLQAVREKYKQHKVIFSTIFPAIYLRCNIFLVTNFLT